MKVYRGYNKEVGPISYAHWTYVTADIEQAKYYATKDGEIKDGAIIEWDLDLDNLRFISLDKLNSFAQSEFEIYSEEDLLWYQEGLGELLYKYVAGIYFTDPYNKDHTIYIVFSKDNLKNGRVLSPEEFDAIQLKESVYDNELNDVLRRAGIQINEEVEKPFIWNYPSYSQFHKILRDNTTYGKLSAIIDGNHIYCWDSAIRHHDLVIEQIENSGINVSDDAIWVRFKEPNICWVSAAYFDDYTDEELDDLPQQDFELELENNPVIKRYFPNGVKIERFNNLVENKQLNEREDLTRFNRIAGFYHYDTKQFELFPRTTEEISTEDDEINDYIHRISSKKELSERHVVRFGIEDIPGEGVICYIEGDTKRNAEECHYAIVDEYQEQCDIIKYEIEYYVGSSKKMIEFDAYGNQIMEGVDRLDEKVVSVNKELSDTKLVTSAYELNEILKRNKESRVVYDKKNNWFLIDNSEVSIHTNLLNDALKDGIYPSFEWNGHIIDGSSENDGDVLYDLHSNNFVLFRTTSDQLNGEDYYYDRYQYCYIYKDYYVFDRKLDFQETPLYKLLGEPIDIENIGNVDEELNESVGGNYLYHGTKLDVLFQILKDNVLQGSESTSGGGYNPYGVSTSRDLNFAYNFADISLHLNGDQDEDCRCVIVLDKNKLKNRYKIIPFRDENAFDVYDDDNTLYPELLEKEEIVLGDIQNVRNYIVGIYVSPDCKKLDTPEEIFSYYYNYLSYNELDRDDLETYVNEYADIINTIMNAKTFTNGRSQYNLRNNINETVVDAMDVNGYTTYMYKNPTMKELRDDKEANGEFRVVRVNDDFFFGDAGYWIHDYMDEFDDAVRLFYNLNTNTFYQDFETISDEEYNEFYQNFVESMQEPYILNTFPNCKFKLFSKTKVDNDTPFGLVESVNKGIDFIAYHGSHEQNMTPAKDRALYLTDDEELAEQFAKGEVYGDGLYDGEVATVLTFKGHFDNPYYMSLEEYEDEGQDSELDYQKWVNMGVDGIVIKPDDEYSSTYYIVIDTSTIKLIDKKVLDNDY